MKAKWIYYPGDYELMLFNKVMTRRYERDIIIPPFWRTDTFYQNVKFRKKFNITKEQIAIVKVDGKFNIDLDGPEHFIYNFDGNLKLTPGEHEIVITVYNSIELPTIYISSEELVNDDKFRMEVMRYKNKDVRIVVKASDIATIHAMISNIEVAADEHGHE